ncbi:uncharacterized protein LOC142023753 [Carettochelys insculpta]|uniref:uncharacterized protein LOC142023753 n=1 Tax=Carettochelys insculpta TaxID=44489 RepID=UPI003EB84411
MGARIVPRLQARAERGPELGLAAVLGPGTGGASAPPAAPPCTALVAPREERPPRGAQPGPAAGTKRGRDLRGERPHCSAQRRGSGSPAAAPLGPGPPELPRSPPSSAAGLGRSAGPGKAGRFPARPAARSCFRFEFCRAEGRSCRARVGTAKSGSEPAAGGSNGKRHKPQSGSRRGGAAPGERSPAAARPSNAGGLAASRPRCNQQQQPHVPSPPLESSRAPPTPIRPEQRHINMQRPLWLTENAGRARARRTGESVTRRSAQPGVAGASLAGLHRPRGCAGAEARVAPAVTEREGRKETRAGAGAGAGAGRARNLHSAPGSGRGSRRQPLPGAGRHWQAAPPTHAAKTRTRQGARLRGVPRAPAAEFALLLRASAAGRPPRPRSSGLAGSGSPRGWRSSSSRRREQRCRGEGGAAQTAHPRVPSRRVWRAAGARRLLREERFGGADLEGSPPPGAALSPMGQACALRGAWMEGPPPAESCSQGKAPRAPLRSREGCPDLRFGTVQSQRMFSWGRNQAPVSWSPFRQAGAQIRARNKYLHCREIGPGSPSPAFCR